MSRGASDGICHQIQLGRVKVENSRVGRRLTMCREQAVTYFNPCKSYIWLRFLEFGLWLCRGVLRGNFLFLTSRRVSTSLHHCQRIRRNPPTRALRVGHIRLSVPLRQTTHPDEQFNFLSYRCHTKIFPVLRNSTEYSMQGKTTSSRLRLSAFIKNTQWCFITFLSSV